MCSLHAQDRDFRGDDAPDDGARGDLLRFEGGEQARQGVFRDADSQSARRLRVEQQAQAGGRGVGRDDEMLAQISAIFAVAARDVAFRRQAFGVGQGWNRAQVNLDADAASPGEVVKMTDETEPGDVGGGVDRRVRADADLPHRFRRARVQGRHAPNRGLQSVRVAGVELGGGRDDAGSQRLGQHENVARPRARVRRDMSGVNQPGYGQPELRLGVFDAMPADQTDARFRDFVRSALQNSGKFARVAVVDRVAKQVHGRDRSAAHCVDVGERIGGGDLPELIGIVHDRREKVYGLDEGQIGGDTIDARVVAGCQADEKVGIGGNVEITQNLRELGWPNLAGSTGAADKMGQARTLIFQFVHFAHPLSVFGQSC